MGWVQMLGQGAYANTTATATRTPHNNGLNEQKQYLCTCVIHFGTFLCRVVLSARDLVLNEPIRVEDETSYLTLHIRKAEEANLKPNFSFFTSISTAEAHRMWSDIYWALWNWWFYCDSGLFLLRRERFVEWRLASDRRSCLPFPSFRRRDNDFE